MSIIEIVLLTEQCQTIVANIVTITLCLVFILCATVNNARIICPDLPLGRSITIIELVRSDRLLEVVVEDGILRYALFSLVLIEPCWIGDTDLPQIGRHIQELTASQIGPEILKRDHNTGNGVSFSIDLFFLVFFVTLRPPGSTRTPPASPGDFYLPRVAISPTRAPLLISIFVEV